MISEYTGAGQSIIFNSSGCLLNELLGLEINIYYKTGHTCNKNSPRNVSPIGKKILP